MSKDWCEYRRFYMHQGRREYAMSTARRHTAYETVAGFWPTHAAALREDSGPFKLGLVEQIEELHNALARGGDDARTLAIIQDVLAQQRAFIIGYSSKRASTSSMPTSTRCD
jgi:hypothetical protein